MSFQLNLNNMCGRELVLQQISDRGIILLFGLALLLYGTLQQRSWRRSLAFLCTALGVAFGLSSVLVVALSSE